MGYYAHPTAVIDEGALIGDGTRIWHFTHIMPGCRIGKECTIGQNVMIASHVQIGDHVKIQNNVSVYEGLLLEDDVFIGPSVVFTNVINPRSRVSRKHEYKTTRVRRGASIGANATILCGNEIGAYAMVGAGAVVTKPVPDHAIVTGNPARQSGWVSAHGEKLQFDDRGRAVCPVTGETYRLTNGKVQTEKQDH